jgi:PhzF family phenazine biosynthesis protein
MHIPLYHVNAFSEAAYSGNPAAVCLLDSWLDDVLLRKVAAENALSATAFLLQEDGKYHLRWFTPRCEVKLCGHATLASGYVLLRLLHPELQSVTFETRFSGGVSVSNSGELLAMDFPVRHAVRVSSAPAGLSHALGIEELPSEVLEVSDSLIAVFEDESVIRKVRPQLRLLEEMHPYVVMVTAPGRNADFASRYFAPSYGVPEDPVTGSAHCALGPYWGKRLGKSQLHARQLSQRGGELWCELSGERVLLRGRAALTVQGQLTI